MKTLILFCIPLFFCHTLCSQNVGIGTTAPKTNLHLAENHSVLFGKDTIGAGAKMMWIPDLGAFRVGSLESFGQKNWDRDSIGEFSFASGRTTKASGASSTAMGSGTDAIGNYSTAMGLGTNATGEGSTAMGFLTKANGSYSITTGIFTKANAPSSTAMGNSTLASGHNSTAMGNSTLASGSNTTAMGLSTEATGNQSIAMGTFARASGDFSTAMGHFTDASGNSSTSIGFVTRAQSLNSTAIGSYNIGGGDSVIWVDDDPIFEIGIGQSEGTRNNALTILKDGRHGILTNEPKTSLHIAEDHSVLFGKDTIGEGAKMMWLPDLSAFRVGNIDAGRPTNWDRDSIGLYSFASGRNTKAKGTASTAMGAYTEANGKESTAMGAFTYASGRHSTAMGNNTEALGQGSTAIGNQTKATGKYSISMGNQNNATGESSFAVGRQSNASGQFSTAMGYFTDANGNFSTAMGVRTQAQSLSSIAIGRFNIGGGDPVNWVDDDPIFEIGIGQNGNTRNNAITILKDGRHGILTIAPKANLHIKDDGTAGSGTIVAVLESSVSDRPILQFSETPIGDADSGMSIEYNGSGSGDNNKLHFNKTNGLPAMTIDNGGQVGIGVSSPTFALHLPDNSASGKARAQSWTTYSDKRIKSDEHILSYGLREIMQLKPLSYKQHDASFVNSILQVSSESENTIGFFAQEVHKVIPEAAIKPENEDEQLWGMEYEKLIPVLVKGMQEQQAEIELLKEEIKKLIYKKENQQSATVQNQSSLFTKPDNKK